MPKEYVDSEVFYPVDESDDPAPAPFRVKIGWSRERGDVQIATLDPQFEDSFDDPRGGMFVWLDRRGCNDLIRILRRARDQAFGADE